MEGQAVGVTDRVADVDDDLRSGEIVDCRGVAVRVEHGIEHQRRARTLLGAMAKSVPVRQVSTDLAAVHGVPDGVPLRGCDLRLGQTTKETPQIVEHR